MELEYDEWVEKYHPIENHFNGEEGVYNNCLFETYGEEFDYIVKQDKSKIWTLISSDNENSYVISGLHIVNRQGFFLCEKSFNEGEEIEVNDNEMITIKDAIDTCINFFKSIGFTLDKYNVKIYFGNMFDTAYENDKITIGDAKYTAIDYWNDLGNELTSSQEDLIHDFYSQLI